MARKGNRRQEPIPDFNPARWAGQISRHIDVAEWADSLNAVLGTPELWDAAASTDPTRQAALKEIAVRLQATTPLYELTAALTAPWLLDTFGPAEDKAAAPAIAANLVALMCYLFDEPGALEFDPWLGLVEWVLSHQTAWAGAAIRRQLGTENIRGLSAEEYYQQLADYLRRAEPLTLRERSDQLLSTYAQELAKSVVETLDLGAVTGARRKLLLAQTPLSGPADLLPSAGPVPLASDALTSLLAHDHIQVMSSAHYQAVREALYLNSFERVEDTPWPTARLALGPSHGQAQLRPPGADGQTALPQNQIEAWAALMWQQREKLSDLDADALDALSALWLSQARSPQDRAVADVDGLLTMRGIQPRARDNGRRVGFRSSQRSEMHQALAHVQNLWITIATLDDPDGVTTRALQSRAFVITDRYGVTDKTGAMVDMERFVFQPGRVFAQFLMGPGQQTALLSAKALHYDTYRQTWEKRLARFLSWQWRVGGDERAQPYRVGALLDACGVQINGRFPHRTRERLEQALDTLQNDGVIAAWQYRGWDEATTQQRRWAEVWRAGTLLIAPPASVVAYYEAAARAPVAPTSEQSGPPPEMPEDPVELGVLLKARRRAIGANQAEAASVLGVSQSYISKLERGTIPEVHPSKEFRARLARWLTEI